MHFKGRVWKDGKYWLAEIPQLDVVTQGKTKQEAHQMIADAVEVLVDVEGFKVTVMPFVNETFQVSSNDVRHMTALFLQRQRQRQGLTVREVAQRLGSKSPNAYSRYERGTVSPTIEKLAELLKALNPKQDMTLEVE